MYIQYEVRLSEIVRLIYVLLYYNYIVQLLLYYPFA
jgi:hypothetical protein